MTRLPIICTGCQKSLTGGIDTFGDIDLPFCWDCYSTLMFVDRYSLPDNLLQLIASEFPEAINLDDPKDGDEIPAEDGLVESRGMLFCTACGLMAMPGNEEFDWCDHITGRGCAWKDDDDEEELEDEDFEEFE